MNGETAVARARDIASNGIAPQAAQNDREGRFSTDPVRALPPASLDARLQRGRLAEPLLGSGVASEARRYEHRDLREEVVGTSAGHARSYVVSSLSPDGVGPTESTLHLLLADSTVLPLFNLGSAAVALGICRAVVSATTNHLENARFEHLGASLGESLPTLRAQLATMQIEADGLAARIDDVVRHLGHPNDLTMLRVLEVKAAGGETAIEVTSLAMRTCGGAAFSKHTAIERFFRDAHAGVVMAPTADVLRELIGKALLGLPLF